MDITSTAKGKLGELYVFQKLIERGAMPFLPIADDRGVDAIVLKKDGSDVEIQIKTTWLPEQAGYFNIPGLIPRDDFFIVCVTMTEPPETWIIPSHVFAANTTARRLLSLGLGTTANEKRLREKLAEYRENWGLLISPGSAEIKVKEKIERTIELLNQALKSVEEIKDDLGDNNFFVSQTEMVSSNLRGARLQLENLEEIVVNQGMKPKQSV